MERRDDTVNSNQAATRLSPKSFCLLDEKRNATRFPCSEGHEFAVVWIEPDVELLAEVHDESLTGLGIMVDGSMELQLGQRIQLVYAGDYLEGEVRHVTLQSDGRYLIGLCCQPADNESV